jgi:hypothetical protein
VPDAAVSIDCQHASLQHFIGVPLPPLLYIDLASPPPPGRAREKNHGPLLRGRPPPCPPRGRRVLPPPKRARHLGRQCHLRRDSAGPGRGRGRHRTVRRGLLLPPGRPLRPRRGPPPRARGPSVPPRAPREAPHGLRLPHAGAQKRRGRGMALRDRRAEPLPRQRNADHGGGGGDYAAHCFAMCLWSFFDCKRSKKLQEKTRKRFFRPPPPPCT